MIAHLVGRSLAPPPAATLREVLSRRASEGGAWLTFHQGKGAPTTLSFSDADALSSRWAAALHEAGVRPRDRVALLMPNSPDFLGAFFGAHELGATPVPLPWPVVTMGPLSLPKGADAVLAVATPKVLVAPAPVEGALVPVVTAPAATPRPRGPRSSAPAFVQFTSGSTGRPRGAVISQQAALTSAWAMADALGLTEQDVGMAWLPFFHDMGLVGVVLSSLAAGFPVHLLPPGEFLLRPRRWLELLSEKRATITVAPNFAFELVLRRAAAAFATMDLSALRYLLNGSEPVLRSTVDAFEKAGAAAGLRRGSVLPVYGLAENALGVSFQAEGAPDADVDVHGRRVPSVGVPLPGMDVAVRRADGAVALEGEEGEITVRGLAVMDGYLGDDEATARALRDGWLWTGDRGLVQGGRLYITGREKELVIKAGRKFHPADIEQSVASLVDAPPNGVAAFSVLREAAGGEELVVVVELRRQQDGDVAARIRGHLSETLGVMADRVELVGAGTLPRTTSGKLKRGECIARFGGARA